jgi:hypothetical protein
MVLNKAGGVGGGVVEGLNKAGFEGSKDLVATNAIRMLFLRPST